MKIGLSGDAFGILILLCTFLAVGVCTLILVIAHKKGVDVTSHRFALSVVLSCVLIFICIPLWLSDLPVIPKIIITLFGLAVGLSNYFAVDRMSKGLKAYLDKKKGGIKSISAICLFLPPLFSAGCATVTKFNAVPTAETDFQLPIEEMRAQYPDIKRFERKFRGILMETPLVDELVGHWGEPDKMEKQWSYFGGVSAGLGGSVILGIHPTAIAIAGVTALGIRPFPPERYYWVKERYCIEAIVDRKIDVDDPYGRKMIYWTWYEFEKEAYSLPEGCRKQKEIAQK